MTTRDKDTPAEVVINGDCNGKWTLRCPCGALVETTTWGGLSCNACGTEGWWDSFDAGDDCTDIPLPMWHPAGA